ncbi:hypothetical protein LguiB_005362 [Lonicera macranthoides]
MEVIALNTAPLARLPPQLVLQADRDQIADLLGHQAPLEEPRAHMALLKQEGSEEGANYNFDGDVEGRRDPMRALEKNGQILDGNVVTLKIGEENAELPFQQGDVIVVQNFKVNDTLRQIRERLRARFVQCGQIKELFLPENLNLQNDKGTAYIEFAEYDGFKKAFHRQYADPLPGDSKRLSIITPKFEEMPFLSRMGGGRGGKWGYKDDNGYIEDDLPEDPTRSLLPIATELASTGSCYLACDTCISFFVPQNEADGGGFCSRLGVNRSTNTISTTVFLRYSPENGRITAHLNNKKLSVFGLYMLLTKAYQHYHAPKNRNPETQLGKETNNPD